MREISTTYSTITLLASHVALYYQTKADGYALFCTTDRFFASCPLLDAAEIAAFEGTLKATATEVDNPDDAFVFGYLKNGNAPVVPKTADGRIATLPNCFPIHTSVCVTGAGDDVIAGVGKGQAFKIVTLDVGATDHYVKFTFNDEVYLAGGLVVYGTGSIAAAIPDSFDYYVHALASVATSTPGAGNCNLSGTLIVPALSGDYTVDLSVAVPVPTTTTGYWDWTAPTDGVGRGTIVANATQTGCYDLYTVDKMIFRYCIVNPLLGSGMLNITVPATSPRLILPHWENVVTIHNSGGSHALGVVWVLALARSKSI